jgi:lipopolysaccharide transport system ATP-binding protein
MVVRLGFAVATALTPDILITDEVLAVGDESFQKKCVAWMERYLVGGGTLLLCSHSMYHIQKLCRAALWLKDGRVERYGAAGSARPILPITRKSPRREAADRRATAAAAAFTPDR